MSIYIKATVKSSLAPAMCEKAVRDSQTHSRYTVRATDPDGFSYDSGYDNMATAQAEIDLLADSKAKYWQGFKFDLYDNLLPDQPPIWSRSVEAPTPAPAPVEASVFCSNCKTRYATGPDSLCNSCRPDQGYTEAIRAADHADIFGF